MDNDDIIIDDEKFKGTSSLWELLTSRKPDDNKYTYDDYKNYTKLMLKTNALHRYNDPKVARVKSG